MPLSCVRLCERIVCRAVAAFRTQRWWPRGNPITPPRRCSVSGVVSPVHLVRDTLRLANEFQFWVRLPYRVTVVDVCCDIDAHGSLRLSIDCLVWPHVSGECAVVWV